MRKLATIFAGVWLVLLPTTKAVDAGPNNPAVVTTTAAGAGAGPWVVAGFALGVMSVMSRAAVVGNRARRELTTEEALTAFFFPFIWVAVSNDWASPTDYSRSRTCTATQTLCLARSHGRPVGGWFEWRFGEKSGGADQKGSSGGSSVSNSHEHGPRIGGLNLPRVRCPSSNPNCFGPEAMGGSRVDFGLNPSSPGGGWFEYIFGTTNNPPSGLSPKSSSHSHGSKPSRMPRIRCPDSNLNCTQ
jgi:hypothetical protein